MGASASSNNDFNRILATQPRRSIDIRTFELPNIVHQQSSTNFLQIPVLESNSQTKTEDESAHIIFPKEPPDVNESSNAKEPFKPIQTKTQSKPYQSIETILSSALNNPIKTKAEKDQILQKTSELSFPHSGLSKSPKDHQLNNIHAKVISRSVMNVNDHRHLKHRRSASSQPQRTIEEHNGKQFLVDFKERSEIRYVQFIDDTTHQMRCFEVIDRIPCRIVRPYRCQSQSTLSNDRSNYNSVPTLQSRQYSMPSSVYNSRSLDNRNLQNHAHQISEYSLYGNNVNRPLINNTYKSGHYGSTVNLSSPQHSSLSRTPATSTMDLNNYSSKNAGLRSLRSSSLQILTPSKSDSDTDTCSSTVCSCDSDDKLENLDQVQSSNNHHSNYAHTNQSTLNNRNNTTASYESTNKYNSPTVFDPFARSVKPNVHRYYQKPAATNNYAEPIIINQKYRQPIRSDYTPISVPVKQPDQNRYYYGNTSSTTVYNG